MTDRKTKEELIQENTELRERIHDLEQLEESFDDSQREMGIVTENLDLSWAGNLGRWDWDYKSGKVIYNPKKVTVLGYPDDKTDFDVNDFVSMIHPDDYDRTMNIMRDHLQGKTPVYEVEYRIRTKSGGYKWFYDRGQVIKREKDGTPVKIIGIVFDVTERKEAEIALKESEERLRKLNASKDRFFSIISHDLRNPFNILLNLSGELLESFDELSEDDIKLLIKTIKESSEQTYKLLENLLEWSRVQIGKMEFNSSKTDFHELAFNSEYMYSAMAKEKNIKLISEIDPGTFVYMDRHMIQTVLRNLITNAIKFTYPGGEIHLKSREAGDFVNICVQDNGVGIDNDIINKLFKIDEDIKSKGTADESGTGLGLILCKEFIDKHGGRIWVESEAGKGSEFWFSLPKNAAVFSGNH